MEKGYTQGELAKKLGVSQNTVSQWENNERYPTIDRIYDIANFLNIPVNALISDVKENVCQAEETD